MIATAAVGVLSAPLIGTHIGRLNLKQEKTA
jgi:hypothetical protein